MSSTTRVKTVDHYWHAEEKAWKHKDTTSDIPAELVQPVGSGASSDDWKEFCFVVVRTFPRTRADEEEKEPTFHIVIKSPYLLQACKDVVQKVPGLSWNDDPVQVSVHHACLDMV